MRELRMKKMQEYNNRETAISMIKEDKWPVSLIAMISGCSQNKIILLKKELKQGH